MRYQLPMRTSRETGLDKDSIRVQYVAANLHFYVAFAQLVVVPLSANGKFMPDGRESYDLRGVTLNENRLVEECEDLVLALSPDTRLIAIGTERGRVLLIDRENGAITVVNGQQAAFSAITALAFRDDNALLVVSREQLATFDLSSMFASST